MTIPWAGQVPYGEQASATNAFMNNAAIQPYIANLPGYANMVGKRSENTLSMLGGNLPQDVQNQIAQRAAERGVGGGSGPASPNSNAALLQALGLSSYDMQKQGSAELSRSIADTPVPELINPWGLYEKTTLGNQELAAAQQGLGSTMPKSGGSYSYTSAPGGFGASSGIGWGIGGLHSYL
jgi:hypothetical protein